MGKIKGTILSSIVKENERPVHQETLYAPVLRDHINGISRKEANFLLDYMKRAPTLYDWMGSELDPINPNQFVHTAEYGDGVYSWNDTLIYFVKTYRVPLPKAFMAHIKSQNLDYAYLDKLKGYVLAQEREKLARDELAVLYIGDYVPPEKKKP